MKSAGNDIVALGSVDKNRTREFRFYSKILSASEQSLYHQQQFESLPFENYVWLLWSVKESVYKYLKRIIPELVFSPTKILTQHLEIPTQPLTIQSEAIQWENTGCVNEYYTGDITYGSYTFYFRSKISKDWIATVVNDNENFDNVCWGIRSIDQTSYFHQSKAARILVLSQLSHFFPGDLQVAKSAVGYPVLLKDNQDMHIPVSLAHDDHFVAYSFLSNNSPDNV